MSDGSSVSERRTGRDRRDEGTPTRRAPRPSWSRRWFGIAIHELLIIAGTVVVIVAVVRAMRPVFANQPRVVEAARRAAPTTARTLLAPTTQDTSTLARMVASPQFQADKAAFAADLVRTGRMDPARADSIAYYAVRESYLNGIPPAVVFGVMLTENSRFLSGALSDVGAVGLMQVYPKIWLKELSDRFGTNLKADSTNLKYGIYILGQYIPSDSGAVSRSNVRRGLLRYSGCVRGAHTPNCQVYPSKVRTFVERYAEAMCGDKNFYECIGEPFLTGLHGGRPPPLRETGD